MIVRIDDISESGLHIKTTRKPQWVTNIPELVDDSSDLILDSDLMFDFNVLKVIKEISVNGFIVFNIISSCSRCLDSVSQRLKTDINLLLSPKEVLKENDGDVDHDTYEGDSIDLSDYFREQIAISLPTSLYCKDDCKGLCLNCGINLNIDQCNCKLKWADTRFAVLKDIKL